MSLKNFMSYDDATTVIGAVKDAIDAAVSSAYHHAGTKTVAQLTHDLLVAANEGNVYNITDSGTTTSDFIEGIGKTIDEGSNVGICKVGNDYKFDLLSGFVDTTNFVQKSQTSGLLKNDGTVNDEIEDDVNQLKSGLTNYENQNNLNLEAPNRKNVLPLTIAEIKKSSTAGTWSGNNYTINGVTFAMITDENGVVTSVNATGTASADAVLVVSRDIKLDAGNYIMNGCPNGGSSSTYEQYITTPYTEDVGDGVNFTITTQKPTFAVKIVNGYATPGGGLTFRPMIRPAIIADSTFAPYIPSVNSRLETVEYDVKLNTNDLTTPSRTKNLLPMTLSGIKSANTAGTWNGNVYTVNDVAFTVLTDDDGNVLLFTLNGNSSNWAIFYFPSFTLSANTYLISCENATGTRYMSNQVGSTEVSITSNTDVQQVLATDTQVQSSLVVRPSTQLSNVIMKPMIRLATEIDNTFTPYIPSVNNRLKAVESGLSSCVRCEKKAIGGTNATVTIPLDPQLLYSIRIIAVTTSEVYAYYEEAVRYNNSAWHIVEFTKKEGSAYIALTFSVTDNNLIITNNGTWGAVLLCELAYVKP